jgi:hypothetical protein
VTKKKTGGQLVLDRSRLLGFDQACEASHGNDPKGRRVRLAKVGTKVGAKPGLKTARA